jgi:hypothetical protein
VFGVQGELVQAFNYISEVNRRLEGGLSGVQHNQEMIVEMRREANEGLRLGEALMADLERGMQRSVE